MTQTHDKLGEDNKTHHMIVMYKHVGEKHGCMCLLYIQQNLCVQKWLYVHVFQ